MSVTYYKCDVKDCNRIWIDDCDEIFVKSKKFKYWQWVICYQCSFAIDDDTMLYYDEDDDCNYLKEEFYIIKNKKIILNLD